MHLYLEPAADMFSDTRAYAQGWNAYVTGKGFNPYPDWSDDHKHFEDGYKAAKRRRAKNTVSVTAERSAVKHKIGDLMRLDPLDPGVAYEQYSRPGNWKRDDVRALKAELKALAAAAARQKVELTFKPMSDYPDAIEVDWLINRGKKGLGAAYLDKLVKLADKHHLEVHFRADQGAQKLVDLYKQHGFHISPEFQAAVDAKLFTRPAPAGQRNNLLGMSPFMWRKPASYTPTQRVVRPGSVKLKSKTGNGWTALVRQANPGEELFEGPAKGHEWTYDMIPPGIGKTQYAAGWDESKDVILKAAQETIDGAR